jgi:uncharacterized protein YndB with AHSA1/START domain
LKFKYVYICKIIEESIMKDRIKNQIELKSPLSRVWKALTDYQEFGEWFRVKLDKPFVPNRRCQGFITFPGYEQHKLEMLIQKIEPEYFFSFTWHPYAVDSNRDYSKEDPTLVEFRLRKTEQGTLLYITESGFDEIPSDRRTEAYRMNTNGWATQLKNIKDYVEKNRL